MIKHEFRFKMVFNHSSPTNSLLQIYDTVVVLLVAIFKKAASFWENNQKMESQVKELSGGSRKSDAWSGLDFC